MVDYAHPVVYRINADDIIEDVNDAWVHFAAENGAPLLASEVIGRSLWHYISGDEVQRIYEAVLKHARVKNRTVSFPFRCDSPRLYRSMRLFVTPLGKERLEFRSVCETVAARPTPLDILTASKTAKRQPPVPMCSWCKAVLIGADWKPIEQALEDLRLFDRQAMPLFGHGICDACLRAFLLDYVPEDKDFAAEIQACITFASRWLRR